MGVVMTGKEELITVEEAAQRFGVPEHRVRQWMRTKKIRRFRRPIDGAVFVNAAEIDEAMKIVPDGDDEEVEAGDQ